MISLLFFIITSIASMLGTVEQYGTKFTGFETSLSSYGTRVATLETAVNKLPGDACVVVGLASSTGMHKDYTCTGTNDHITINLAIQEAENSGKNQVLILPGTYDIAGPITMSHDGIILSGCGLGTILLRNVAYTGADTQNGHDYTYFDFWDEGMVVITGNHCRVTNMTINGHDVDIPKDNTSIFRMATGINLNACKYGVIDHCFVTGCRIGIGCYRDECRQNQIINNRVYNNDYGIYVYGPPEVYHVNIRDILIANNTIVNDYIPKTSSSSCIYTAGIYIIGDETSQILVSNNVIRSGGEYGIGWSTTNEGGTTSYHYNESLCEHGGGVISGNIVIGTSPVNVYTRAGIHVMNAYGVAITGNQVHAFDTGIYASGYCNLYQGNVIIDCVKGIELGTIVSDVIIGNVIARGMKKRATYTDTESGPIYYYEQMKQFMKNSIISNNMIPGKALSLSGNGLIVTGNVSTE